MTKQTKREIALVDDSGVEWVRAALTPPAIKRMIRLYMAQGVRLEEVAA